MSSRMNVRRSFSREMALAQRQGAEEEDQGQLDVAEQLEQERPEAGRLAERGGAAPAERGEPGGDGDDPQAAQVGGAGQVVTAASRNGDPLAQKDRPQHHSHPPARVHPK